MLHNELHTIGVTEEFRDRAEMVDPRFVREGLLNARDRSWKALADIYSALKEGITEIEARRLAISILRDHGAEKHWHQPTIRFGVGTALTFHDPLRSEDGLQPGQPVSIDLGPVWADGTTGLEYEGDVGDTLVFGNNGDNADAQACADAARELFRMGKSMWLSGSTSGRMLYDFLRDRSKDLGYQLIENVMGHRLGDFPHKRFSKDQLPNVDFHPSAGLWILEVQIAHPTLPIGAFYEDLLT